jgi:hypothetical protein
MPFLPLQFHPRQNHPTHITISSTGTKSRSLDHLLS